MPIFALQQNGRLREQANITIEGNLFKSMKQKGLIICIIFALFSISVFAQQAATPQIEWLSFEQVEEKMKTEKKKLIVAIYRDACGWCKKMEETTFQEPFIIDYVNRNFYAVKLNAEQEEDITFQGETYQFVKSGKRGHHELAVKITRGEQGSPSIVFLNEEVEIIQSLTGYKEPLYLEKLMTYFAEDHHRKTPWIRYESIYQPRQSVPSLAPFSNH